MTRTVLVALEVLPMVAVEVCRCMAQEVVSTVASLRRRQMAPRPPVADLAIPPLS